MLYLPAEPSPWGNVFRNCAQEAFHLEVRDAYMVPAESERFRRFLDGQPALPDDEYKNSWNDLIRETTGRGVSVSRVHVVTVPHTDCHR
ncbi:DUF6879 family protein [Nocardia vaccinii]|uniref:DUF6879 family protein n=1 Tax=Nocardia vaccinii TaxID=1822 RepID=UPI000AB21F40|nr:DUF6879 family protein [Nocardia vaccinii]